VCGCASVDIQHSALLRLSLHTAHAAEASAKLAHAPSGRAPQGSAAGVRADAPVPGAAAEDVKEGLSVHFCTTYDDVFGIAFPEQSAAGSEPSAAAAA